MNRVIAGCALGIVFSAASAQSCNEHFVADGNFLTGKSYKTWAVVPGVKPQDAFARAYAFTIENGFTVVSSDKAIGVISAVQTVSYGQGKTVPLNLTFHSEGGGTRVAMSYATSGGVMSPEDAIKRHFCMTIDAAAAGGGNDAAAGETPVQRPVAAARSAPTMRGFATPSDAQSRSVAREIPKSLANPQVRELATDATPAIATFVERVSCLADYTGASALNEFAAPRVDLGTYYVMMRPMRSAQYHDKSSCMTVTRVAGWRAPANNALQFEVVYKADDSGEVAKLVHETVRQPDGTWLFTK